MNFIEFLENHFIHALPLIVAGVFAFAIIMDRYKALYHRIPLKDVDSFFEKISSLVMAGKIQDATEICNQYPGKPVARLVKEALQRAHLPETIIEDGLTLGLAESNRTVLARTNFLATIANVATLLGLFGTIAGLIHSFEAVGHADAQQKAALLSAGIATAMNATMLGLAVAIPCLIAFSILMSRSNHLMGEMESSATKIKDILKQRFYTTQYFEEVRLAQRRDQ